MNLMNGQGILLSMPFVNVSGALSVELGDVSVEEPDDDNFTEFSKINFSYCYINLLK